MNCSFVYFLIEKAEEKYKTADGKVNGKTKSVKHYLSPTNILFKFSMGVVEKYQLTVSLAKNYLSFCYPIILLCDTL